MESARGREVLFRVEDLIPGNGLPGVSRLTSHNAHESGLAHVVAVVDDFSGADGAEEGFVLGIVHIFGSRGLALPVHLAGDAMQHEVGGAFSAVDQIGAIVGALIELAAVGEATDLPPAGQIPLEDVAEVVIDIAELRGSALLTTAGAGNARGRNVAHHPKRLVEAVDVLLDDVIAGEIGVIEPVADLVLHVAPLGLAGLAPEPTGEVVGVDRDDFADLAGVDLLHRLHEVLFVAVAQAGNEVQAFLGGGGREIHHFLDALGVHADGLLAEYLLALFDGILEMRGPEVRGGGQQHNVHTVDEVLVAVPA